MMAANIGGITPALLLGVMWAGIALAGIFAIIKTTIRLYVSRRLFVDDLLVYFALMLLTVMGILYTLINDTIFEIDMVSMGEMLPPPGFLDNVAFFLRAQFAIIVIFWTTLWAVKLSLLMYYKKLFAGIPGNMHRFWWAVTIFAILSYVGCWVTQLLSCTPISTYFTGECNTPRDIYVSNLSLYYATSVDIICDIFIMALPLRLLWNLQINMRQKFALAGIFSLGVFIIIFAVVRVIETSATFNHVNPLWLELWSMIEASVAVVVSCLPSFRAFFSARNQSYWKKRSHSSGSRFSRFSRSRKVAVRLDDHLTPTEGDPDELADFPDHSFRPEIVGGLVPQRAATGYTAGAEGLKGFEYKPDCDSREDILPTVPQNSVHIRNDFYMTTETV